MRTRYTLLLGVLLVGAALLTGSAVGAPADDHHLGNETENATGGDVGICMIGVDSPCNGERWDGDDESQHTKVENSSEPAGSESEAGICMIGVDSPCNSEHWDGTNTTEATPITVSAGNGSEASVGICVVGADSPCNSPRWQHGNMAFGTFFDGEMIQRALAAIGLGAF